MNYSYAARARIAHLVRNGMPATVDVLAPHLPEYAPSVIARELACIEPTPRELFLQSLEAQRLPPLHHMDPAYALAEQRMLAALDQAETYRVENVFLRLQLEISCASSSVSRSA